jgi:hypothetical protein
MQSNELKIELYPNNKPRYSFPKQSIKNLITKDVLSHSLNVNQNLAYTDSNVPLLNGFYTAHTNHYPIRIKPDDIWLLIIQAFSNHVNANSEELKNLFVDFDGKQRLIIRYPLSDIKEVNKVILENFSEKINNEMTKYLGEDLIEILTPNFSTTTYDSIIVCKISIMGSFKKNFDYEMQLSGCGIPYIILEGTVEDYKKIIEKSMKLKRYKFEWYINRIIPHIEKMVEAKEGKIDKNYFMNMIQKKEIIETTFGLSGKGKQKVQVDYLSGWFLSFFAYYGEKEKTKKKSDNVKVKIQRFEENNIKVKHFQKLANQMLIVPFKIVNLVNKKEYLMKYKVGFVGCDQNDKNEIFPIQGWFVSPSSEKERNSIL